MAQVLIRNLTDETVQKLKERAKRNGRSLQTELKIICEKEIHYEPYDIIKAAKRIREKLSNQKHTDSVKLLREDRRR